MRDLTFHVRTEHKASSKLVYLVYISSLLIPEIIASFCVSFTSAESASQKDSLGYVKKCPQCRGEELNISEQAVYPY